MNLNTQIVKMEHFPADLRKRISEARFERLSLDWQDVIRSWAVERLCIRCNVTYREIENLGRWRCGDHPLSLNRSGDGRNHREGRYECCGYAISPHDRQAFRGRWGRGCTASDHSEFERPYDERDRIILPPEVLRIVKGFLERGAHSAGGFVIPRLDEQTAQHRVLYGVPPRFAEPNSSVLGPAALWRSRAGIPVPEELGRL